MGGIVVNSFLTDLFHFHVVALLVGVGFEEPAFLGIEVGRKHQTAAYSLGRVLDDSCRGIEHGVGIGNVALDVPDMLAHGFFHRLENSPDHERFHPQFVFGAVIQFFLQQVMGIVILGS